ncbi:MAG TPA: DUF4397 domain-containing protein [Aggregatilineales bacterium]|nr:DUF4397 domain-containing protein [Aggregatilineales bacterium]
MTKSAKLALSALFLLAASVASILMIIPGTAQAESVGSIRIVNGLLGIGPVDVYLNDRRVAYGLLPEDSTSYFCITPGQYSLAIRPQDADPLSAPVTDMLVNVSAGLSKTAIAWQRQFASVDYQPMLEQSGSIFVLEDDRSALRPGYTRVRAAHLAPGAPEYLTIGNPRAALIYQLGREQQAGSVDINAAQYQLALLEGNGDSEEVLERLPDTIFNANMLQTLVIVPDVRPPELVNNRRVLPTITNQLRLFTVSAPVQTAPRSGINLRFVNAAFNSPVVDVYMDGALIAPSIPYAGSTTYQAIDGFVHTLTIRRAGSGPDGAILAEGTYDIAAAQRNLTHWTMTLLNGTPANEAAAAAGQILGLPSTILSAPGSSVLMSMIPDNVTTTNPSEARLRLVNAVDGLLPISLQTLNNVQYDPIPGQPDPTLAPGVPTATPGFERLINLAPFGGYADEFSTRIGQYSQLNFVLNTNGSSVFQLNDQRLIDGMVYTYMLVGSASNNPPIRLIQLQNYGCGATILLSGQEPTATPTRIPPIFLPTETFLPGTPTLPPATDQLNNSGGNSGGVNVQPTRRRPTSTPRGNPSATAAPPTSVPPTDVPPTAIPPTAVPPTDVPPTAVPPTDVPPTAVPPTDVPPTAVPPTDPPVGG